MKIENRQQFLMALTIGAVALYVGVNFFCVPLSHAWSARSAQLRQLRAKVSEGRQLIRREPDIRRKNRRARPPRQSKCAWHDPLPDDLNRSLSSF